MSALELPDEVRAFLTSVATSVDVFAGETVGEHCDAAGIAVVAAGRFAVVTQVEDERSRTIALVQEGDALVLHADDDDGAPDTTVVARTDSQILVLADGVDEVLALSREAGAWLLGALVQAVADREVSTTIALEPRLERRLLLKLRQLAHRWGRVTPEGVRLDLRVTHQELADMVGAARESVTVAFGRLQEQGEIEMRQRTVILRGMNDQTRRASEMA